MSLKPPFLLHSSHTNFIQTLVAWVDLYIHQSGLDTSTPSGRMMFQMVGVFSEFERSMISERVKSGLERVKKQGKKLGRKKTITDDIRNKVYMLMDQGKSYSYITNELNVPKSSISRLKKERGI